LAKTAWDLGVPGKDSRTGHGLINVLKATAVLMKVQDEACSDETLFESMLEDPKTYSDESMSRAALMERTESCLACPSRMDLLYRAVLLASQPELLSVLASQEEFKATPVGFGMQFMAFNRPTKVLDEKAVEQFAAYVNRVQAALLSVNSTDFGLFESLANPELILAIGKIHAGRKDLEGLFISRMALVAPDRLDELKKAMTVEVKTPLILTPNPSEPKETEPEYGPGLLPPMENMLSLLLAKI
jgi:hypothetical protein